MSLFGREPRPVYRVYAEDEYDGEGEPFGAEAHPESVGATGQTESAGSPRTFRPALTTGSLELRRRPAAFLVVGLLVLVAVVVGVLVLSNASRRAPHRSASAASGEATVTAGRARTAAPPAPTSTPARREQVRRARPTRRPFATARAHTDGDARASMLVPVPAAVERPLSDPPAASVAAEFGFER
jgi:hypothetical protein